jgi:multidrug efflux pump subunit AcrB
MIPIPVHSSAEVIARITEIAERVLPRGIELEWTDLSYQQVSQSNAAPIVFLLAIILVFLVLASLHESWTLPLAVILIVPMCITRRGLRTYENSPTKPIPLSGSGCWIWLATTTQL